LVNSILRDTIGLKDEVLKNEVVELAMHINRETGSPEEMFPFVQHDSVVVYRFNQDVPLYLEYIDGASKQAKPIRVYKNGKLRPELFIGGGQMLTRRQVFRLRNCINDTRNFTWGYLGAPDFTKGIITYYVNGSIKAFIHLSSQNVFSGSPRNIKFKHGLLAKNAVKMRELLMEIGL
jgi:hypothetical protein